MIRTIEQIEKDKAAGSIGMFHDEQCLLHAIAEAAGVFFFARGPDDPPTQPEKSFMAVMTRAAKLGLYGKEIQKKYVGRPVDGQRITVSYPSDEGAPPEMDVGIYRASDDMLLLESNISGVVPVPFLTCGGEICWAGKHAQDTVL